MRRLVTVHSHGNRNRKHQALLDIAWKQWDKIILADPTTEVAFSDWVKAVCERLNKQFPKCKTIGVYTYSKGHYITIAELPYTSETCDILSINISPAEQEYTLNDILDFKKIEQVKGEEVENGK